MPVKRSRPLPEYRVTRRKTRAGFVPGEDDRDVELWTIWARSDSGDERRATFADVRKARSVAKRRKT